MQFRSKPVVIEAEQFFSGDPEKRWPPGVSWGGEEVLGGTGGYVVTTIHGHVTPIEDGDWIIREPDGVHYYPCKPDIFAAKYEPVK